MIDVDLLITQAAQVVTCSGEAPKRGEAMRDVGIIEHGGVAVKDGRIAAVGPTQDLVGRYRAKETIDASGQVVLPGFVDAHTHVVYAGDRVAEFELRIGGATYMEIMAAGGGIVSTMKAVRRASMQELVTQSRARLNSMLTLGTTTVEAKTGYGLSTADELKLLNAIAELDKTHPIQLVPTFLGAHAVPPEYRSDPNAYVDIVVEEMLPQVRTWYEQSHFYSQHTPFFCDVFCEDGVFDIAQSRRVLDAGRAYGLLPKIHADEFVNLGGVRLAVDMHATSVDHLDVTPAEEAALLATSDTIGVVIPAVNFHLGSCHFADARGLIDAGVAVALATDINPGSAPCPSIPMVMAIATRYQRLLPAEALNAVTLNAAYAVGLGEELGSLQPGKLADLVILNTHDYRHLAYQFGANLVDMVFKHGRRVR